MSDEVIAAYTARRPGWSASNFVIEPCRAAAGGDDVAFAAMLDAVATTMELVDDNRFEQHAVPVAGRALAGRPAAMCALLEGCAVLARDKIDAGWYVQLVVEPLATAATEDAAFATAWHGLVAFASELARSEIFAGYPYGTAIAALLGRNDLASLPRWLELLAPLARAAKRDVYGLFEYGVTGLARGGLDASDVSDAIQLAIAMFDHGIAPGPTLAALSSPIQLDIATKLAKAGVDPALVITNGLRALVGWLAWDEVESAERLTQLAIELHRRGLRQLVFEDGLEILLPLEHDYGRLASRGFALIERMVARDLEPGVLMRWHLPRVIGRLRAGWAPDAVLSFAEALVEAGIAPEPAIGYAAPALAAIATDAGSFRVLAMRVVDLATQLQAFGIDHREVLFHDVAHLAEAGKESQTFGELLAAFGELLAAWSAAKLDPTALLSTALPIAARESAGRPWVLAIALRAATRLGREGRAAEATTLLSVGVTTATHLGAADADAFTGALASLEMRYAALPAGITSYASIAAGVIAGTDIEKLDHALAAIATSCATHGPALVAIAPALPDLARVARDATGLVELAGILVGAAAPVAIRAAAIVAQCAGGSTSTVDVASRSAGRQLEAVLAWADSPEKIASLDRFGNLGRVVSPDELVASIAVVHEALAPMADRRPVSGLLEHARTAGEIRDMCRLVPPLVGDGHGPIVDGLRRAKDLVAHGVHAWTYLVAPALVTAKQHATPLINAFAWLPPKGTSRPEDLAVIRDLITQRGVRAGDYIANLIAPALARGTIASLAEHRDAIERYLRDVGFADADVFAHFLEVDGDAAKVRALRGQIDELVVAIRAGEVSEALRAHALFGVALQYVFPAAVSVIRRTWERLVATMPDRPGDVTAVFPNGHAAPLEVAAGDWDLVDEPGDLDAFAWFARVTPGDVEPRPLVEIGWELLGAWSENRLAREPARIDLARALLAHAPAGSLPASPTYDSAAQLQAIRAVAADRLADLVETAVTSARASDGERADRLVRTKLAPAPRVGPGLVKAIGKALAGDDPGRRIAAQLAAFELPDDIVARLRAAPDLGEAIRVLPPKQIVLEPGKELGRIHADLVGQDLAEMAMTIARALVYRKSASTLTLDVTITKRSVHAPIGLAAGVCVASDLELWQQPGFMHLALWLGGVCAGSVHLLVVEEDGARYLALPGINPTFSLLEQVEAPVLVRALLDRIAMLAREAGLAGVWIPTAPGIHSNRGVVHDALVALELPVRTTRGHAFSYSPYAYRIDDVWAIAPTIS